MSLISSEVTRALRRGAPGEPDHQDVLDAFARGDVEAGNLLRQHYYEQFTPYRVRSTPPLALTPKQIHNLKTRAVPRPPAPPPPPKKTTRI